MNIKNSICFASIVIAVFAMSPAFSASQTSNKGRELMVKHTCAGCHGTEGQGSSAGKKLAPEALPFEVFSQIVRTGTGPRGMPRFGENNISDADLKDIYAHLSKIPNSPSPDTIIALKDLKP